MPFFMVLARFRWFQIFLDGFSSFQILLDRLGRISSFYVVFACSLLYRSSDRSRSVNKSVLKNFAKFTIKHLRQSFFFNKVAGGTFNFIQKETLAQVFSYKFCEIFKNTFFLEHLWRELNYANRAQVGCFRARCFRRNHSQVIYEIMLN